MHAVFVPDAAIGEADLAADRPVAFGDAHAVRQRRDAIGVVHQVEIRDKGHASAAVEAAALAAATAR